MIKKNNIKISSITIFIIYFALVFAFRNIIFSNNIISGEILQILHVSICIAFIISLKNKVLNNLIKIRDNIKLKFLAIAVIIVSGVFLVIFNSKVDIFLKENIPNDWLIDKYYTDLKPIDRVKDYLLLFNRFNFLYTIRKIVVIDFFVSNLFALYAIFKYRFTKERGEKITIADYLMCYVNDLGKFFFKYNFLVELSIMILLLPSMYLLVRRLQYIIIAFLSIYFCYTLLRSVFGFKEAKNVKDKKLVIYITINDIIENRYVRKNMFKLLDKYRKNKSISNSTIDTKRCIIAEYKLIANGVIAPSEYKDTSYIIYLENK